MAKGHSEQAPLKYNNKSETGRSTPFTIENHKHII